MKVLLPKSIISEMRSLAFGSPNKNEVGGILLGYRRETGIEITKITTPEKWDFSSPNRFIRSHKGHKEIAINEWKNSNHTIDYVGEWHSHPKGSTSPSLIDISNWKEISKAIRKDMVHVIIGREDESIFVCSRTNEIELINENIICHNESALLLSPKQLK